MHVEGLSLLKLMEMVRMAARTRDWGFIYALLERYPWHKPEELALNAAYLYDGLMKCATEANGRCEALPGWLRTDFGLIVDDDAFDWTADDHATVEVLVALWICTKKKWRQN